jgi:putative transposon-encoded protein
MKKVKTEMTTQLIVEGIEGYMERKVTRFGNGAKIDCPKEYLGKKVYVVISKD